MEDDPLHRAVLVSLMEEEGLEVVEAADVKGALTILGERSDIGLLLADVYLAGWRDGLELAQTARRHWPRLGIILVSADHRCPEAGLPRGAVFLSKPYPPAALVAAVLRLAARG